MNNNIKHFKEKNTQIVKLYSSYQKNTISNRIGISTAEGIEMFNTSDIIRCQADSNYCSIHLKGGRAVILSKTLKNVELRLPNEIFIRVHQSHIINTNEIRLIQRDYIKLTCGKNIPISRSKRASVIEHIYTLSNII